MAGPGTAFTGPLISGPKRYADQNGPADVGLAVLSQVLTLTYAQGATAAGSVALPFGSQIVGINIDTTTAWNTGGTTPSAEATVGLTSGGSDFAGPASTLTAGRAALTYTGAQLEAALSLSTSPNTTVYAVVTQTAASGLVDATAGSTTVTIMYVQTVQLTAGDA